MKQILIVLLLLVLMGCCTVVPPIDPRNDHWEPYMHAERVRCKDYFK
jgi:uncharacterized protein YceK